MWKRPLRFALNVAYRLPLGNHLRDMRMKQRIANGSLESLVPSEELGKFFRLAIEEQTGRTSVALGYFEAGVFAGHSMALWHEAIRETGATTRSFGADSFEGLPASVASDDGAWLPGSYACPRPVTEWNLARLGAPLAEIRLIEGWFDETLTAELAAEVGRVHVAMLDADAYSSTVPVLAFLGPLFDDVAWLVFDDWYSGGNLSEETDESIGLGVEQAFDEWLSANPTWVADTVGTYDLHRGGTTRKAGRVVRLEKLGTDSAQRAP